MRTLPGYLSNLRVVPLYLPPLLQSVSYATYTSLAGPCTSHYGHVHLDNNNYITRYGYLVSMMET